MKPLLLTTILFACVSCVGPQQGSSERRELSASVDEICAWTGMTRTGPIKRIERWRTDDPGYNVSVDLAADRHARHCVVRFTSKRELLSFMPEPFDLGEISLGADTLKDSVIRARCIAAVSRLNRHLQWTWFGRPVVQRVGEHFFVTYKTVSEEQQKRAHYMYIDPYVSFLVTRDGTVFGVFWGA